MRLTFEFDLGGLRETALVHLVAALLVGARRGLPAYGPVAAALLQEVGRRHAKAPTPGPQTIEVNVEPWTAPRLRQDAACVAAAFRGALDMARSRKCPIDLEALADCGAFAERLVGAIDLSLVGESTS